MTALEGSKIIDFEYFGTVNDIQDTDWVFDQSEDSNIITKENLNCDPELKEDFDTFFHKNDEILCMSNTVPYLDKSLYKPIFEDQ